MNHCPSCGSAQTFLFFSQNHLPVHSVRLLYSKDEAQHFPTGQMDLAFCSQCGFIWNASFDPDLQDYSDEYESTQAYSPTFNRFAANLAQRLVDNFDLHQKDIIEIGCGQGEFISLLCQLGQNRGIGFDPSFDPNRPSPADQDPSTSIIADYYSEKYAHLKADFICCKMTLEHIRDVATFMGTVRRSIGENKDATIFFQVPDVSRILEEFAFWDIYYEHCSYFSMGSMARLFRSQGFNVERIWREYGSQYLLISAKPASGQPTPPLSDENDLQEVAQGVTRFSNQLPAILDHWREVICEQYDQGKKVVLWGSGSKGVAFLTTLGIFKEIQYTVDINPNKTGTFMAITGQEVVAPDFLASYRPDLVIMMNPLYRKEAGDRMAEMGVYPQIMSVGE
jgi:2-polyprenyl-3-methyl-5-hydroxy-6-metoxy-1,4-benzoquinol methylase